MKKQNRNFVVEYKSGRRKADKGSNSIWGNIDLGSVFQDVDDASFPAVAASPDEVKSRPFAREQQDQRSIPQIMQPTTTPALPESTSTIADEDQTMPDADVPTVADPAVSKKVRKPRAKKRVPEPSAVDAFIEQEAIKPRRGRRPKSIETASSAKASPIKPAPKAEPVAPAAHLGAIDEIVDLLQLEEENKTLRRQLVEKLRAENADLKRRLSLA